jgi:hypothetical protein
MNTISKMPENKKRCRQVIKLPNERLTIAKLAVAQSIGGDSRARQVEGHVFA